MANFTSEELYKMNGGNKMYIHRDGFGEEYQATAEEEARWKKELIDEALARLTTEINSVSLIARIDTLRYHDLPNLQQILLDHLPQLTPAMQIAMATALWKIYHYEHSFTLIHTHFLAHPAELLNPTFTALQEFHKNPAAKDFLLACLRGQDAILRQKAVTTIGMWAYMGIPAIRNNRLLDRLEMTPHPDDITTPGSDYHQLIDQLERVLKNPTQPSQAL